MLSMIDEVHAALGVRPAGFRLSLRGAGRRSTSAPTPTGTGPRRCCATALGDSRSYVDAPGEAAFYGPKIDIQVRDAAGRELTLSTVQVDFHQPAAFDLSYVDRDGARRRPVMVHRSLVGSMERLFAYLIEVHAGAFPAWYAPVQLVALPVGADQVGRGAALVGGRRRARAARARSRPRARWEPGYGDAARSRDPVRGGDRRTRGGGRRGGAAPARRPFAGRDAR